MLRTLLLAICGTLVIVICGATTAVDEAIPAVPPMRAAGPARSDAGVGIGMLIGQGTTWPLSQIAT